MSSVLLFTLIAIAVGAPIDWLSNDTPPDRWGSLLDNLTLPPSFDARTNWTGCIHAIQNEDDCVGSWAMAAADVLSDRFCIQARTNVTLSPQYLLNCQSPGCSGGISTQAWSLLSSQGVPTSKCTPFTGETGSCPIRCDSGVPMQLYKSTSPQIYSSIDSMKAAILQNGPIQSCFQYYSDFSEYRSGVYEHTSGAYIGITCAKVIGWGLDGQKQYWIGAAYFGKTFGMSGFFYIKMGQLGIESAAIAGNPSS